MGIANNITTLRKAIGLTQEKLAEKCNVSRQAVTKWEIGESEPTIERLIMLSELFNVSIDDLVKDKEIVSNNPTSVSMAFEEIESEIRFLHRASIGQINDLDEIEMLKLHYFEMFYGFIKKKYVGLDGKVYKRYLVKNTTEKQRDQYLAGLEGHLAYTREFLEKYIDGICEIDVALDETINEIRHRDDHLFKRYSEKDEKDMLNKFQDLQHAVSGIKHLDKYNDEIKLVMEKRVLNNIPKLGDKTLLERFLSFVSQEVIKVLNDRNVEQIKELEADIDIWELYVRSKISIDTDNN